MATPTEVKATETWIQAEETKVTAWLKAHERIIIVGIIAVSTLFLGGKFLNNIADRDRAAAAQSAQVLTQDRADNAALVAQIAKAQDDYKTLVIQLTQQNSVLQTQIAQRQVVYQQQVTVDKTLPMPDLGNRWAKLASLNPQDITATTAGISVTPEGALSTVVQLEQVPVLTGNLADVTAQKANLSTLLDSSDALNGQLTDQVKGLQTTISDSDKACKTEIASVKASARSGKLKAFLYGAGVGAGVVTAFVIHALL